jgi:3'-phosphoadenosine 5'-phosphosulfate sulfotransferase (PAPS reductase)/FAD synthetase
MSNIKHVVSFSGGMGSFAEAKSCVDQFGKNNVTLLFSDTMMEDEDLYRFKDECVKFLKCELITLSDGRTPFEVFKDEKFMGNSRVDPCSKILKC